MGGFFFFSSRRRHTRFDCDWSSDVCSSDLDARELAVVYDVAHNIAKVEEHVVDGAVRRLIVHRKGATRAFPGQPVIVPGDMGRYSFLLVGTEAAMRETFGSTCHGAGRLLSRTAAVKAARGRRIDKELRERGVVARATGKDALAEEMRSEEHTSELQSQSNLVCRLLLEKKKKKKTRQNKVRNTTVDTRMH